MAYRGLETNYNSYRFRSRLEARWAVFFDALRLPYRYEPEGFDLGNGVYYLPDFWLPGLQLWVEVKPAPEMYDQATMEKCSRLAAATGKTCIALVGDVWPVDERVEQSHFIHSGEGCWDNAQRWCQCPNCGAIGFQFRGWSERLPCACRDPHGSSRKDDTSASYHLMRAYQAARSARFENR